MTQMYVKQYLKLWDIMLMFCVVAILENVDLAAVFYDIKNPFFYI
jgi:hypothetical protein